MYLMKNSSGARV